MIDDDSLLGSRPLMMVDIAAYNDGHAARNEEKQRALIALLAAAADESGLERSQWLIQHQGDSELAILPNEHNVAVLFTQYADALSRRLDDYNRDRTPAGRIRLRMAVHHGPVVLAAAGFAGAAPGVVARLVECGPLRAAMADLSRTPLVLAVSAEVYRAIVLGGLSWLGPEAFVETSVKVKELSSMAWLRAPGVGSTELRAALAGQPPQTPAGSQTGQSPEQRNTSQNIFYERVGTVHIGPTNYYKDQ